ncbi:hypothetical protein ANN_08642 [Periplaneta americana]|uniref:Uncharacterized protein n=1 Tax=Periplaneta americana TaxID=6978 RepID=A0ABQ8T205_PERAM|nr:hypothetical protein ANN_08642 [Periplaneta americana]
MVTYLRGGMNKILGFLQELYSVHDLCEERPGGHAFGTPSRDRRPDTWARVSLVLVDIRGSSTRCSRLSRLRVFENKVLRKIFGAKRDEVTGEWRKLHSAELHALYSSPDIIRNIKSRRLRWAGHVAHMGESRNAYRVLVGRPEGKRPLGRPRRRWEDNIKMDLREVGYDVPENAVRIKSTALPCEAILDYEFNPPRNALLELVNKLETTGSLGSEKCKHRSSRLPTVVVASNIERRRMEDIFNICYRD